MEESRHSSAGCCGAVQTTTATAMTFKFFYGDDIRRWTPAPGSASELSFSALSCKVVDLYGISALPGRPTLKYEDPEGDCVTLACESDLAELLRLSLPLARVVVSTDGSRASGGGGGSCSCSSSSDSEAGDGHWTPRRVDEFLARLGRRLALLEEDGDECDDEQRGPARQQQQQQLVRMLARGFEMLAGDAEGRARVVRFVRERAASSSAASSFLAALAFSPSSLRLGRAAPPPPVAARNLAGLAVAGGVGQRLAASPSEEEEGDGDGDEEEEEEEPGGGCWSVDRYLGRLSECLARVTAEDPTCTFRVSRLLARGAARADEQRVVCTLREAAAASEAARGSLARVALAAAPAEIGFSRGDSGQFLAAQALAAQALGFPEQHGRRPPPPPPGAWRRGGRGCGPRGGGGRQRWRMLSEQVKPRARLVCGMTVPDEARVAPGQRFTKVWRVANAGELPWDPEGRGLALIHVGGDALGAAASTPQRFAADGPPTPGETADLAVEMTAPAAPGRYEGFFRLARLPTPGSGEEPMRFGQRVWARIFVVAAEENAAEGGSRNKEEEEGVAGGALRLPADAPLGLDDWVAVPSCEQPE